MSGTAHSTALWAALTTLFVNLAAVNIVALVGSNNPRTDAIASVVTALFVAGSVYAKIRWDAVKKANKNGDEPPTPPVPPVPKKVKH